MTLHPNKLPDTIGSGKSPRTNSTRMDMVSAIEIMSTADTRNQMDGEPTLCGYTSFHLLEKLSASSQNGSGQRSSMKLYLPCQKALLCLQRLTCSSVVLRTSEGSCEQMDLVGLAVTYSIERRLASAQVISREPCELQTTNSSRLDRILRCAMRVGHLLCELRNRSCDLRKCAPVKQIRSSVLTHTR